MVRLQNKNLWTDVDEQKVDAGETSLKHNKIEANKKEMDGENNFARNKIWDSLRREDEKRRLTL